MLLAVLALLTASAAEPTLPVLEEAVPAVYPADQLDQAVETTVLLLLDIDATGAVTAVEVVESGGPDFDTAAVAAARDFRFQPALDARGEPAPARIQYRVIFSADAAPVVSATGTIEGSDGPLVDAVITARGPDDAERSALSDSQGRFSLAGLAPGEWTLSVDATGYETDSATITVVDGRVSELTFRPYPLAEEDPDADLIITVSAPRREPEIVERALTAEEVRYLPGTNGDVVRAVQNLPGIARPPLNIGQLLIRGTSPEDSAYYVDGVRIPIVFHFAGLSTVVAGDSLEEVTYFPGNFGVRYGNVLGGGVDLRFDPKLPKESNGFASVDVYQGTIFHEQRLGDSTALTISGRRSWIDAILNPILNNGSAQVQAPRYYDGQARLVHETESNGTFDALLFFSDDRFRVLGGGDDEDDNDVLISLATHFQKARLSWRRTTADGWRAETTLLAGPEAEVFQLGSAGEAYERAFAVGLRHEVSRPLAIGGRLRLGFDGEVRRDSLKYDVPAFGPTEESVTWRVNPALYVEPTFAHDGLRITPGVRFDPLIQDDGYATFAVDPRLAATWDFGTTVLKASTGRYSQFPTARQVAEIGSTSPLEPAVSWQNSVGFVQDLGPWLSLEATGFYNRLDGLVVGREDTFRFFTGPPPIGPFDTDPYANDGTGTIVGSELQLKLNTDSTTAWIAATFSRSTRIKRPGADQRLFTYDQPIVLTAVSSSQLGRGWRLGGRIRYGSGNPYTPVVNRIYSLDTRAFQPVYGAVDSERLPGFFSLDVRVDKQWEMKRYDLSVYLDLQNATNAQNPEVMAWTDDYSEQDPITSLPTIPGLGVRVDW